MKRFSLLKSGFWTTYGAIATRVLTLLGNLVLARLLLPSEFGVIGVAYIFWAFANLFTQGTAGDFIVYKGIENPRYLNTTYTIGLGLGLVLALGMVALAPLAAQFFGIQDLVWILIILAFNLLLASIQSIYAGVLTRRMEYRELANSTLIASFIRISFTAGPALIGFSYWSFVIGDTAYWLSLFALTRHFAKQQFQLQIDSEARAEVLSYCLGATGSSLGYYVNANGDNFTIGKLLGSTSLGYYNFAYQLTMAINSIFASVIGQIGMPVFAQIPDDREQENALLKVVEHLAYFSVPLYALFFLVIDQQAIALIFGEKWIPAYQVIPWLLVFAYFRLLNTPLISMLSAKGKPGVNAKVNLSIAPLAVLGFIFGALQAGIFGVGIAVTFVLGIVWTFYWWWMGCRELGWSLSKFLIPCFKPVAIALPALLISVGVPDLLEPFLFIVLYLLFIRFVATKQFFLYQSLATKAAKRLKRTLVSHSN